MFENCVVKFEIRFERLKLKKSTAFWYSDCIKIRYVYTKIKLIQLEVPISFHVQYEWCINLENTDQFMAVCVSISNTYIQNNIYICATVVHEHSHTGSTSNSTNLIEKYTFIKLSLLWHQLLRIIEKNEASNCTKEKTIDIQCV